MAKFRKFKDIPDFILMFDEEETAAIVIACSNPFMPKSPAYFKNLHYLGEKLVLPQGDQFEKIITIKLSKEEINSLKGYKGKPLFEYPTFMILNWVDVKNEILPHMEEVLPPALPKAPLVNLVDAPLPSGVPSMPPSVPPPLRISSELPPVAPSTSPAMFPPPRSPGPVLKNVGNQPTLPPAMQRLTPQTLQSLSGVMKVGIPSSIPSALPKHYMKVGTLQNNTPPALQPFRVPSPAFNAPPYKISSAAPMPNLPMPPQAAPVPPLPAAAPLAAVAPPAVKKSELELSAETQINKDFPITNHNELAWKIFRLKPRKSTLEKLQSFLPSNILPEGLNAPQKGHVTRKLQDCLEKMQKKNEPKNKKHKKSKKPPSASLEKSTTPVDLPSVVLNEVSRSHYTDRFYAHVCTLFELIFDVKENYEGEEERAALQALINKLDKRQLTICVELINEIKEFQNTQQIAMLVNKIIHHILDKKVTEFLANYISLPKESEAALPKRDETSRKLTESLKEDACVSFEDAQLNLLTESETLRGMIEKVAKYCPEAESIAFFTKVFEKNEKLKQCFSNLFVLLSYAKGTPDKGMQGVQKLTPSVLPAFVAALLEQLKNDIRLRMDRLQDQTLTAQQEQIEKQRQLLQTLTESMGKLFTPNSTLDIKQVTLPQQTALANISKKMEETTTTTETATEADNDSDEFTFSGPIEQMDMDHILDTKQNIPIKTGKVMKIDLNNVPLAERTPNPFSRLNKHPAPFNEKIPSKKPKTEEPTFETPTFEM